MIAMLTFKITEDLTISFSANALKNMIDKVKSDETVDENSIESCVVEYVTQRIQKCKERISIYDSDESNDERYRQILKDDAAMRFTKHKRQSHIELGEFIDWCWEWNAGHWPDGTPIIDD